MLADVLITLIITIDELYTPRNFLMYTLESFIVFSFFCSVGWCQFLLLLDFLIHKFYSFPYSPAISLIYWIEWMRLFTFNFFTFTISYRFSGSRILINRIIIRKCDTMITNWKLSFKYQSGCIIESISQSVYCNFF